MRRIESRGIHLGRLALGLGMLAALVGRAEAQSESWDAVFIGNAKVGSIQVRVIPVKDRGRALLNVLVNYKLDVRRDNDSVSIEMEYGTIETPDGEVLRLDTRTHASNQVMRAFGDVVGGKMKLKMVNGSQQQEEVLDWGPEVRGPYGPEMSFTRAPMKPGEVRQLRSFMPNYNKVVAVTLKAGNVETIALGGGAVRELLKVDGEIATLDNKPMPEMNQTFWVDPSGQVLKTFNDNFGGTTTYRTTKEAATRQVAKADQLDLIKSMVVRLTRKISKPENSRDILYKVSLTDADPAAFFPSDRRQTLKPTADPRTATLTVRTAGPTDGAPGDSTVADEYSRSNPLITSDDPQVVRLARQAVGAATDPWAQAQAINKWVASNIKDKNFSTSFAPADEVARDLQGDCTEHGVLVAAMCRAAGIPARVVIGLVYADQLGGFGYHMWDEVYVNRRWVAIDSAFDQTQVDAVHLKLSDSSLAGVAPFDTFTAVARVATKLKIEAVEVR